MALQQLSAHLDALVSEQTGTTGDDEDVYDQDQRRPVFHAAVAAVLYLFLAAAALMWSWNLIGHDLFGAPLAEFRHGLASALALLVIAVPFRARCLTGGRKHTEA